MASIPVYDTPQVTPQPLPDTQQHSVASPEIFGEKARQQIQMGKGLLEGGNALAQVAVDMQHREDADNVFRAEVGLKDSYLQQEQQWRESRQGRSAKGITDDVSTWWAESIKKNSENLANGRQQQLFMRRALRYREQSMSSMSHYESQQLERSHDEAWVANKNVTISTAAASPSVESVDTARLEIDRSNRYQAQRKGWEPEVLKDQNTKDLTELHKQVLQGIAKTDPAAATAYFEKWKGEIDGKLHAELGEFAKKTTATSMGESAADDIWKTTGPKFDTEPANLDKMETQIREKFKGNEFAVKAGISALRDRVSAFDKGRAERESATESVIWKAVNGGARISEVQAMPEYLQLNGKQQNAIKEHMESYAHTREAQAEADKTRKYFAAYLAYSRPEALDSMSANDIINLTPVLGNTLAGHLMEKKQSMGNKVIQAGMDQQDFDHVAAEVGLRPFDPHKNEKEKAALGELKFRIEQAIDVEQGKAKRPLTRDEKMQLLRREMDNQVIQHNTIFPDQPKAAILLSPDELKDAYVMVDGQKVKLATIPADERATIIKKRQERGLPVSEQAIASTWLRAKQKKPEKVPTIAPAGTVPRGTIGGVRG